LSTRRLWLFLAVALPVLAALAADLPSVDLAYHLRAGDDILRTGAIPSTDTYTFTAAGERWLDQNWGAQVLLALVFRIAGWTGLAILRAALVGLVFGSVLAACRRLGVGDRTAALLTLGAFVVASFTLALRPQLFGIAIVAMILLLTTYRRERPRLLWLAVPLIAVWANIHGSFVLGIGLLGLVWIGDLRDGGRSRHLALAVATASAVAASLNPAGLELWRYAAGIATSPTITSRITEWQPPDLRSGQGLVFYGSALVVAAFLARRSRPTPWPTLLTLAAFFLFAVLAVRGLAWWPLVVAVTLGGLLAPGIATARFDPTAATPDEEVLRTPRPEPRLFRRVNLVIAVLLVVVGLGLLPVWRPIDRGLGAPAGLVSVAPPGITARLRELAGPNDRLFAPQPWGSWFEYAISATPVFVDSRIELFPPAVWDEYDVVVDGVEGWRDILDRRAVTMIVAVGGIGRNPLASRLAADPTWREAYADEDGRIFVRTR
jgi:hypothetical protein